MMKYIVVKNGYGHEEPIIFSDTFKHKEVFEALRDAHLCKENEIVSAGIVGAMGIEDDLGFDVRCSGFSTTLFVGARSEDNELIRKSIDMLA